MLYLRPDRRNPELPVCAGAGEASWHGAFAAHGRHVSGLSGDQQLHPVHVADVPSGQQRAAAHVPGARALAASLARDVREGRRGTEERRAQSWCFSVSQCRLALVSHRFVIVTDSSVCVGVKKNLYIVCVSTIVEIVTWCILDNQASPWLSCSLSFSKQEVMDNSSNGIPQITYNSQSASPWQALCVTLMHSQ